MDNVVIAIGMVLEELDMYDNVTKNAILTYMKGSLGAIPMEEAMKRLKEMGFGGHEGGSGGQGGKSLPDFEKLQEQFKEARFSSALLEVL